MSESRIEWHEFGHVWHGYKPGAAVNEYSYYIEETNTGEYTLFQYNDPPIGSVPLRKFDRLWRARAYAEELKVNK